MIVWDAGFEVQAPVIQTEGRIVLRGLVREGGDEFIAQIGLGDSLEMAVEDDVADKFRKLLRAVEGGGRGFEAGRDGFESGAAQAGRGGFGVGILPRLA